MITDSFEELGKSLLEFLKNNDAVYLRCDVNDFRKKEGEISLHGKTSINFKLPDRHLNTFAGIFFSALKNKKLYTWDAKKLFTYLNYRIKFDNDVKFTDIKYVDNFFGVNGEPPQSLAEAQNRARDCPIHESIHIPLATRTLPKIESVGLVDVREKKIKHAVYEIEGQSHGRLRCKESFPGSLLMHNLKKEDKESLRSNNYRNLVTLDYKAMEVCVLQYLSKDERLGKIISSGRDIYSIIYCLLYGSKSDDSKRQFIKKSFLPVVYGLQSESLSTALNVSLPEAEELISKIKSYFSTAMGWVQEHQDMAKKGLTVRDYFGRPRTYEKSWVVRNAIVQGPAAVVCLEKLIELTDKFDVVATIHDAYVVEVSDPSTAERAAELLQSPSKLLPNLRLSVDVNSGIR